MNRLLALSAPPMFQIHRVHFQKAFQVPNHSSTTARRHAQHPGRLGHGTALGAPKKVTKLVVATTHSGTTDGVA